MSYPETCEICHNEKAFVHNLDNNKWYGTECAFIAGNPTAAQIKAQQSVDALLAPIFPEIICGECGDTMTPTIYEELELTAPHKGMRWERTDFTCRNCRSLG